MPLTWITGGLTRTQSATGIAGAVEIIHDNNREVMGQLTLIQKAVVVATHMCVITDTDDLWRIRVIVAEQTRVLTAVAPEDSDPEIKGIYPYARGPVYLSPKRKIDIPVEARLALVMEKFTGSTSSIMSLHFRFLLFTSMTGS